VAFTPFSNILPSTMKSVVLTSATLAALTTTAAATAIEAPRYTSLEFVSGEHSISITYDAAEHDGLQIQGFTNTVNMHAYVVAQLAAQAPPAQLSDKVDSLEAGLEKLRTDTFNLICPDHLGANQVHRLTGSRTSTNGVCQYDCAADHHDQDADGACFRCKVATDCAVGELFDGSVCSTGADATCTPCATTLPGGATYTTAGSCDYTTLAPTSSPTKAPTAAPSQATIASLVAAGAGWVVKGADIDGEAASDWSGQSVSMSADGLTVAVGATNNDAAGSNAGHVRIYTWGASGWVQRGADIDGEARGDMSGISVSLSADSQTVAIGGYLNDAAASNAGHVRIYTWGGSGWVQRGADIDGEATGDGSGDSVSLSADGLAVAVGASGNDGAANGAGHVRIYTWGGSGWVQRGADIDGEAADDNSGRVVSLSADGQTVAISAHNNDGAGATAGHVRIYTWGASGWVQAGADIDGEAAHDQARLLTTGNSVSLSADGQTVAIGALSNDGAGNEAGHVRVYSLE
jgi:hypothetical protein